MRKKKKKKKVPVRRRRHAPVPERDWRRTGGDDEYDHNGPFYFWCCMRAESDVTLCGSKFTVGRGTTQFTGHAPPPDGRPVCPKCARILAGVTDLEPYSRFNSALMARRLHPDQLEGFPEIQEFIQSKLDTYVATRGASIKSVSDDLKQDGGRRRTSTSTPRARRSSASVGGKVRVVLTATGNHADIVRRAATKRGVTLSQLAADMIEALPQDIPKPKRMPTLEKGEGSAVLCVYEEHAKRVRELVETWEWKLAQVTAWLVERLEE